MKTTERKIFRRVKKDYLSKLDKYSMNFYEVYTVDKVGKLILMSFSKSLKKAIKSFFITANNSKKVIMVYSHNNVHGEGEEVILTSDCGVISHKKLKEVYTSPNNNQLFD